MGYAHPTGQRTTQANLSLYHSSAATVFSREMDPNLRFGLRPPERLLHFTDYVSRLHSARVEMQVSPKP